MFRLNNLFLIQIFNFLLLIFLFLIISILLELFFKFLLRLRKVFNSLLNIMELKIIKKEKELITDQ